MFKLNLITNETITYLVEDGHFTISKKMKALLIENWTLIEQNDNSECQIKSIKDAEEFKGIKAKYRNKKQNFKVFWKVLMPLDCFV